MGQIVEYEYGWLKMKFGENKKIKILITYTFISLLILMSIILVSWYSSMTALYEFEREEFSRWFGSDDNAHQYAMIWQEGGLGLEGLGILHQEQVDEILASRRFEESGEEIQRDIEALLLGGFPLVDKYGSEARFEAERFLEALRCFKWVS